MQGMGIPVVFDATHSVQLPGAQGSCSGGQREFVPTLARAAAAIGVAGIFMEVHPDPDKAPCDGPNMLSLKDLPAFLDSFKGVGEDLKGSADKVTNATKSSAAMRGAMADAFALVETLKGGA